MAWVLHKEGSNEEYRLLTNREYVVGRKDANIILSDDQSISRKHALLCIGQHANNVSNPVRNPLVTLKDVSKYGTTLNGRKVDSNGLLVNNGDKITFGILHNNWQITCKPFICSSSVLSKEDKLLVRQSLAKIGGHLVAEWIPQCTLLVMNEITMTIKVVNALVALCHIVRPRFLEELILAIESGTTQPAPASFLPSLMEKLIKEEAEDRFSPNRKRKTLFIGKQFYVFSAKQLKKLQFAITVAGGKIEILEQHKINLDDILNHQDACILQPSSDEAKQDFVIKITSDLSRHGIRFISEAEIGLAILHCSTEKFCNPKSSDASHLLGSLQSTSQLYSASFAESESIFPSIDSVKTEFYEAPDKSCNLEQQGHHSFSAATVEETFPSVSTEDLKIEAESVPIEEGNRPTSFAKDLMNITKKMTNVQNIPLSNEHKIAVKNVTIEQSDYEGLNSKENTSTHSVQLTTTSCVADRLLSTENHEAHSRSISSDLSIPAGYMSSRNLQGLLPVVMDDCNDTLVFLKLRPLLKRRRVEEGQAAGVVGLARKNFKKFKKVLSKHGKNTFGQITLQTPHQAPILNYNDPEADNEINNLQSLESESAEMFNWPVRLRH